LFATFTESGPMFVFCDAVMTSSNRHVKYIIEYIPVSTGKEIVKIVQEIPELLSKPQWHNFMAHGLLYDHRHMHTWTA